ncbi:MAG: hypothetical protein JW871_08000 [Endomicrobiales bacterium]|nr:hypothetical protein [Endomicrobiales bacterium]
MKNKKSPILAAVLSAFVFPGAGQFYSKQYTKGMIIVGLSCILIILMSISFAVGLNNYLKMSANVESVDITGISSTITTPTNKILSMMIFLVWVFSTADAYISTKKRGQSQISDIDQDDRAKTQA